jgi:hypothetical protein
MRVFDVDAGLTFVEIDSRQVARTAMLELKKMRETTPGCIADEVCSFVAIAPREEKYTF